MEIAERFQKNQILEVTVNALVVLQVTDGITVPDSSIKVVAV